jgi:hypothetical protein
MMFNNNGLYGVKGVMFDCYKTLIDIKTDEKDLKTYESVSRWLMYHGVNISPQDLMNEYRWRCKEELERRGEWHCELKVEDVFSKICRQHASWPINDITVGIEAAPLQGCLCNACGLFPRAYDFWKAERLSAGNSFKRPEGFLRAGAPAAWPLRLLQFRYILVRLRI